MISTIASDLGTTNKCLKPLASIILNAIGINNPAKTERGMYAASLLKPNKTANKNKPCMVPESLVLPPLFILITVPLVAPAPGIPHKIPAIALPIPCPINSLLLLCFVLVILSAITDVSNESIEPKTAKTIAYSKIRE